MTMSTEDFSPLRISRFELRLRAREAASLPPFLGSTVRGAFGRSLKQTVCVMAHRNCERCMVADRCIYPYLFETPVPPGLLQLRGQERAPHPFILSPPAPGSARDGPRNTDGTNTADFSSDRRLNLRGGDEITFGLTLMGRAAEHLPYLVYAVIEMSRRGLGTDRGRFELAEVLFINPDGARQQVYSGNSHRIETPTDSAISLSTLIQARLDQLRSGAGFRSDSLKLRFVTPTRIRAGDDLQSGMSFELLVRNLLRRVSLLCAVHGRASLELDYRGLIERARSVRTISSRLEWCDWERYSNRQQTKMKLGGFMGEIEYGGEISNEFLSLIVVGEILHVGGGTSFGLGRYEIAK